jgi:hypothetical protein
MTRATIVFSTVRSLYGAAKDLLARLLIRRYNRCSPKWAREHPAAAAVT